MAIVGTRVDNEDPVLDSDDSPDDGTTGDLYGFDLAVYDNIAVDRVCVNWTHGSLNGNLSLDDDGDGTWSGTINLDDNLDALRYFIWFNDTSNNIVKGPVQTVTVTDNDLPCLDSDDSPNAGTTGDEFTFDIWASDNIDVDEVGVNWTHGNLDGNLLLTDDGDGTWTGTILLDHSLDDLTYRITINDTSGNYLLGSIQTIRVTDNDPPRILYDGSEMTGYTGNVYQFVVEADDNIAVSDVYVVWAHGGLSGRMNLSPVGNNWEGCITLDFMSIDDLTYTIFANDTSGNLDAMNNETNIWDDDIPWFLSDDNTTGTPTTGDAFLFNVSVADNIDVDYVCLNYSYDNVLYTVVFLDKLAGVWWDYQRQITVASDAVTLYYGFDIFDTSGNWHKEVRTPKAVTDNDPPVFLGDATMGEPVAGEPFTMSAMFTDNIYSRGLRAYVVYNESGKGWVTAEFTDLVGIYYNLTILIPEDATTLVYYFIAEDATGNKIDTYEEMNIDELLLNPIIVIHDINIDPAPHTITIDQRENVTFNGTLCFDTIGIMNYTWTFTYDGVEQTLFGELAQFTFDIAGTYLVWLNVTDAQGKWGRANITVTVNDITAPIGVPEADDSTVEQGGMVTFNGSDSSDNVGIVNYTWTFGDDVKYGMEVNFTFPDAGMFTVFLKITDAAGNYNETNLTITVADTTVPVADAGMEISENADAQVFFDGSGSADNVGIRSYLWTFLYDGKKVSLTGEVDANFTFEIPGVYNVTLTVTDHAGNSATDWMKVIINGNTDSTSTATVNGVSISDGAIYEVDIEDTKVGKKVVFKAMDSIDNVGIVNWTWTILSGSEVLHVHEGRTTTFTFIEKGAYTVVLRVEDDAGNHHEIEFTVPVSNAPVSYDAPSDKDNEDSGSLGMSTVVTIILGILALIVIVLLILFFVVFRKKKGTDAQDTDAEDDVFQERYKDVDTEENPMYDGSANVDGRKEQVDTKV